MLQTVLCSRTPNLPSPPPTYPLLQKSLPYHVTSVILFGCGIHSFRAHCSLISTINASTTAKARTGYSSNTAALMLLLCNHKINIEVSVNWHTTKYFCPQSERLVLLATLAAEKGIGWKALTTTCTCIQGFFP